MAAHSLECTRIMWLHCCDNQELDDAHRLVLSYARLPVYYVRCVRSSRENTQADCFVSSSFCLLVKGGCNSMPCWQLPQIG